MDATVRIGTSGFSYSHWRGIFYPQEMAQSLWLEYYAGRFDTVELNNTFYAMPKSQTCRNWRRRTPEGFSFTVKLNRWITHRKRLADCGDPLGAYLDAVGELGEKLGAILVQLPPNFRVNADRLDEFLSKCPAGFRWALEFRNPTWLCEEVYDVLRRHGAALVVHDLIENHPRVVTADWVYLRYHGPAGGDTSYTVRYLSRQAGEINQHRSAGRDVYAYFNNDVGGHAVRNAQTLLGCLAKGL